LASVHLCAFFVRRFSLLRRMVKRFDLSAAATDNVTLGGFPCGDWKPCFVLYLLRLKFDKF
jgi:hypothetical protein